MDKRYYKTDPMSHQISALQNIRDKYYYALFMDMGTGKTKVSIDDMSYLYLNNKILFVLVIAPNSNYMTWADEIKKHSVVPTHVYRHKIDKKFTFKKGILNYYLMNVEAFSHASGTKVIGPLVHSLRNSTCIIVDESTRIKNRTAKRTKSILKLSYGVAYKRILSGFPVTKSPLDLWSQCSFLRPGLLGTDNFYAFRATYSIMRPVTTVSGRIVQAPVAFQNLDHLLDQVKNFSFRVRKEDCLDLPPKIYHTRLIEMTPEQTKIYNELKNYARTILKDEEASYQNKLTEIIKLHQVANGFVVTNDGSTVSIPNRKMDELHEVINETDDKIIIWSNYVYTIKYITKELEKKYGSKSVVNFYGDVTVKDRHDRVDAFQNNKDVRFFVANPATGGIGLTLTAANTVVYFSNNFNLEERVQSEDRAHRKGQKKVVNYIDLICAKTIDVYIKHALTNKLKLSAKTMGEDILDFK